MNIWLTLKSVDLMNAITISCLDHREEKKRKKKEKLTFLLGLSYQLSYQFRRSPVVQEMFELLL